MFLKRQSRNFWIHMAMVTSAYASPTYLLSNVYEGLNCQHLTRNVAVLANTCIGQGSKFYEVSLTGGSNDIYNLTYHYYNSSSCSSKSQYKSTQSTVSNGCIPSTLHNTSAVGDMSSSPPTFSDPGIQVKWVFKYDANESLHLFYSSFFFSYYGSETACESDSSTPELVVWYPIDTCFRNATHANSTYSVSCSGESRRNGDGYSFSFPQNSFVRISRLKVIHRYKLLGSKL